jgi:branched-chain amino acid transport system substrate-binding protein
VLARYRSKYGEPGPYSFYSYDAANVLLEGIRSAGTTDGPKVSEAIHRLTYDGITGRIRFDEKGDVPKIQYVVWITRNGKFEEFWKPPGMTETPSE